MKYVAAVAAVVVLAAAGVVFWTTRDPLGPFTGFPEGAEVVAGDEGSVPMSEAEGEPLSDVELGSVDDLTIGPGGRLAITGSDGGVAADADSIVRVGVGTEKLTRMVPDNEPGVVVSVGCRLVRVGAGGKRTDLATRREMCPVSRWAEIYGDSTLAATFERIGPIVDLDLDPAGTLYLADAAGNRIHRLTGRGELEPVAGSGKTEGHIDNGADALMADFKPEQLAVGARGELFVIPARSAQNPHYTVYRIEPKGSMTAVGGGGAAEPADDLDATEVEFAIPTDVAADAAGNVYVALNRGKDGFGFGGVVRIAPDGTLDVVVEPALDDPEESDETDPYIDGLAVGDDALYLSVSASGDEEHHGKVVRLPLDGS